MSLKVRSPSIENRVKVKHEDIAESKPNQAPNSNSTKKYIKLNRNISLPSIRDFRMISNANTSKVNTKSPGLRVFRNSSHLQQANNSASLTSLFNAYKSRNVKNSSSIHHDPPSSLVLITKIRNSKPKLSSRNIVQDVIKPPKTKSKINKMFDKIFQIDDTLTTKINRMKSDHSIALKKDFNLPLYQSKLLSIAAINTSTENLRQLNDDFKLLNELINSKFVIKKTKWQVLANRIRFIAPENLIIKLNSLQVKGKRQNAPPNENNPL